MNKYRNLVLVSTALRGESLFKTLWSHLDPGLAEIVVQTTDQVFDFSHTSTAKYVLLSKAWFTSDGVEIAIGVARVLMT